MKLKNKKTGEIVEPYLEWCSNSNKPHSLAELNEEWEDYDDTKDHWCIAFYGEAKQIGKYANSDDIAQCKQIGNYFENIEEAEKAVEKLKAWKRLKDKGFEIYSWDYEFDMVDKPAQTIILRASAVDSNNTDLDLLFGGEE